LRGTEKRAGTGCGDDDQSQDSDENAGEGFPDHLEAAGHIRHGVRKAAATAVRGR
jgi:hypothetical protein